MGSLWLTGQPWCRRTRIMQSEKILLNQNMKDSQGPPGGNLIASIPLFAKYKLHENTKSCIKSSALVPKSLPRVLALSLRLGHPIDCLPTGRRTHHQQLHPRVHNKVGFITMFETIHRNYQPVPCD